MVSLEDIKLPPHNIDAEKAVICGVLMDNELLYVCEGLGMIPEDFYQKDWGRLSPRVRSNEALQILLTLARGGGATTH